MRLLPHWQYSNVIVWPQDPLDSKVAKTALAADAEDVWIPALFVRPH